MRVPTITTYSSSTYRLGNLTRDLKDANEVVSTQKRINEISDDPIGMSQTLSLKSTVKHLDQIKQNVVMGKSWLEDVENAMTSVNDLIIEAKSKVSRLASDSATADEREDAIVVIDNILEQVMTLGNLEVNGNYLFSGTDTDVKPLEYVNDGEVEKVEYKGNNTPFEVRTDKNSGVAVGRDGKETFWDRESDINSTNNTIVFKEDNDHGSASEKMMEVTIPEGMYDREELVTSIKNQLNDMSAEEGYGLTYDVAYDEASNKFRIQHDGTYDGYMQTEFLWKTGGDPYVKNVQGGGSIQPEDIDLTVTNKDALSIGTPQSDEGEPFRFTYNKAEDAWDVENNPGYVMPFQISGTDRGVQIDLNESGTADVTVKFDKPLQDGDYVEFDIVSEKGDHSTGHEIGFNENNMIYEPPVSDTKAEYITDIVINTSGNNTISFEEINSTGGSSVLTANFNTSTSSVSYTDMDILAGQIESAMESISSSGGNTIDYAVSYDPENSRFNIREDGSELNELNIRWDNSTAAADTLGYYPLEDKVTYPHTSVEIDTSNNVLDFQESTGGAFTTLQVSVDTGIYNSMSDLATAVEESMETVSASSGHSVNYDVTFNETLSQFEITGSGGTGVTGFNILWESGSGKPFSIAETLGYDPASDDTGGGLGSYDSDTSPALMNLFSTDIDGQNNTIDFEEVLNTSGTSTTLQAEIPEGTYESVRDLELALEQAMNQSSDEDGYSVTYDVSYDEAGNHFDIQRSSGTALTELKLLWDTGDNTGQSIGETLGYDVSADDTGGTAYSSSSGSAPTWISFDSSNNMIDYRETAIDGTVSEELSIEIPEGDYNDLNTVASEIQTRLRNTSPNSVNYNVMYDSSKGFMIKGSSADIEGFDLLWQTGKNSERSASEKLGFLTGTDDTVAFAESDKDVVNLTVDSSNNKIDFKEIMPGDKGKTVNELTAELYTKTYKSYEELAAEIEEAFELESRNEGNTIDYNVSYDSHTGKFTIKENGTELEEFQLLWQSGSNAPLEQGGSGQSIGSLIGFNGDSDDVQTALNSNREVEWGIFNTLIDLKEYLSDNDVDGIERTINRLETNFDMMSSRITDSGMKYSRLEIRETITNEVDLTLTERRSMIEDADMIESIMKLKNIQNAYQAALNSTSKVLNMSLVDFL